MSVTDIRILLDKLNNYCQKVFQQAVSRCINNHNYELTWEHIFYNFLDDQNNDTVLILRHFGVDVSILKKTLTQEIEAFPTGNTAKPTFSPSLVGILEKAWNLCTLQFGDDSIRSGVLFTVALDEMKRSLSSYSSYVNIIDSSQLSTCYEQIVSKSLENQLDSDLEKMNSEAVKNELEKFCKNLTAEAKAGKIDTILGRDSEICQVVDILSRRRKNNPILVGEAGVGKTAIMEGLAQYIAADLVPETLKNVEIWELDLGLLQAGASVKGEFEKRLKSVIDIAKKSGGRIVLFIDEAHTLIGAGGAAGMGDAANLLKPALARGELRVCAATTWLEYRKYFEKDPALTRRFQMIKVDEPDEEKCTSMLRGIVQAYQKYHGVHITEEALKTAVYLSKRYISGRQLPDKAVDVLDTACTRVKMSQTAIPPIIENYKRKFADTTNAVSNYKRDFSAGIAINKKELAQYEEMALKCEQNISELTAQWEEEKIYVERIKKLQRNLLESSEGQESIRNDLEGLYAEFKNITKNSPMVFPYVSGDVCAQVIADWTGIPIGSMVKNEAQTLLELESKLSERVKGQNEALSEISSAIRSAKTGISNPDAPLAVFLCTGPSGVGKTECAMALADLLFGGEKFSTVINMSEYQEAHSASQLKGSPPGYVGYGEGGVLTEAVRQKPYSIVILDEVEKAHRDILNMFYQVFDKGMMRDGEGRDINFRNTVIFMTSNLGSETIFDAHAKGISDLNSLIDIIRPELTEHFQPALLARCTIIPFVQLTEDVLRSIIKLKLDKVKSRLVDIHNSTFAFTDKVVSSILNCCSATEAGARNIDMIINSNILPAISKVLLSNAGADDEESQLDIVIDVDENGVFNIVLDDVRLTSV